MSPAGFWRRWGAFLVDQLLFLGAWAIFSGWTTVVYLIVAWSPLDVRGVALLTALLVLLWFALSLAWSTVFVGGCGQTPGKMLFGIAVVREDGGPLSYWLALGRALGFYLAALPLGLGFLGVLFTRRRRGLHDWLAGTVVVRVSPPPPLRVEPAPAEG